MRIELDQLKGSFLMRLGDICVLVVVVHDAVILYLNYCAVNNRNDWRVTKSSSSLGETRTYSAQMSRRSSLVIDENSTLQIHNFSFRLYTRPLIIFMLSQTSMTADRKERKAERRVNKVNIAVTSNWSIKSVDNQSGFNSSWSFIVCFCNVYLIC